MVSALCPKCMQELKFSPNLEIGQKVRCSSCHSELEVTWLYPVSLDFSEPVKPEPARTESGS